MRWIIDNFPRISVCAWLSLGCFGIGVLVVSVLGAAGVCALGIGSVDTIICK